MASIVCEWVSKFVSIIEENDMLEDLDDYLCKKESDSESETEGRLCETQSLSETESDMDSDSESSSQKQFARVYHQFASKDLQSCSA